MVINKIIIVIIVRGVRYSVTIKNHRSTNILLPMTNFSSSDFDTFQKKKKSNVVRRRTSAVVTYSIR